MQRTQLLGRTCHLKRSENRRATRERAVFRTQSWVARLTIMCAAVALAASVPLHANPRIHQIPRLDTPPRIDGAVDTGRRRNPRIF